MVTPHNPTNRHTGYARLFNQPNGEFLSRKMAKRSTTFHQNRRIRFGTKLRAFGWAIATTRNLVQIL
jgi:hypothetical protein